MSDKTEKTNRSKRTSLRSPAEQGLFALSWKRSVTVGFFRGVSYIWRLLLYILRLSLYMLRLFLCNLSSTNVWLTKKVFVLL